MGLDWRTIAMNGYNGIYTISTGATKVTFFIRQHEGGKEFSKGDRVVMLLPEPIDEMGGVCFGLVRKDGTINFFQRLRNGRYKIYSTILENAMRTVTGEGENITGTVRHAGIDHEVMISKRCRRCNGKMQLPENFIDGIHDRVRGHWECRPKAAPRPFVEMPPEPEREQTEYKEIVQEKVYALPGKTLYEILNS
jgi:hypothetical protein